MQKMTHKLLLATVSCAALAVTSSGAYAQVFEEIVVTAQKRDQNLQDVAVSVTAFSGDAMKAFGFNDSVDVAAQVPGLNIGTPVGEGNNPSFTLRGVGLNDFNDNNESPIAIYTDGVYMAALPGLTFQLFDTERVEVLRGPQGTLYGRNATGGLIHFVSNKPTDEFEAYGQATYGSYNQLSFEGAVSGPISDGMRARLSVSTNNHDGYVKNRLGKDANEADSIALRGQLEFDIGDSGSLLLKGFHSEANTVAPQYQHEPSDGIADIFGYKDTDGDNFAGDYNREGVLDIQSSGGAAVYSGTWGNVNVTNTIAYSKTKKLHEEDTDVGPVAGVEPTFRSDIKQFSEELTLSGETDRMNWVAGLYYFDAEVKGDQELEVNWFAGFANALDGDPAVFDGLLGAGTPSLPTTADDVLLPAIFFDVNYTQKTKSFSGYGQVEYELSERLSLTAGLRYSHETKDMEYLNALNSGYLLNDAFGGVLGLAAWMDFRTGANNDSTGIPPLDAGAVGTLNKIKQNNLSGKVGLDFNATDDLLLYANVSRGFKSGGFNTGFSDATDGIKTSQLPYADETLTAYEVGFKWGSPSGNVTMNGSAFYYDYNDFQALTFQGLSQVIANSDATYKGAEIEFGARPFPGLTMQLGASVLDANVEGVTVNGEFFADLRPVLAPEFTANGFIRYEQPVDALGGVVSGMLSFNHQGNHYFDITNSPQSKEEAYTLVDARLSYLSDSGNVEVAAFAKNLFNKEYRVYTFDFGAIAGFNQQFYGQPRWFGVQLTLRR